MLVVASGIAWIACLFCITCTVIWWKESDPFECACTFFCDMLLIFLAVVMTAATIGWLRCSI